MTEIRTTPGGTAKWTYDATANDSDKSFTVPSGKVWQPLMILGNIACTATVGNRNLLVTISNGTALVWNSIKGGNIAASGYGNIQIGIDVTISTTGRPPISALTAATVTVNDIMPYLMLPAGYIIRVYDLAAVDAAADDLIVSINYIEYDA